MRGCCRNWLTKSKAPQRETAAAIAVQVAHAVGVFRMRSRLEARRPLLQAENDVNRQRVEPIAQFSNHRPRAASNDGRNRENGGNRVRMGTFLPKRPVRLSYP